MKYIILESDDFGITPEVSTVIAKLLQDKKISTTNCMTTLPGFDASVKIAQNAGITKMGIHFIADRHQPASDPTSIPTLVQPNGLLNSFDELKRKVDLDLIDYDEVRQELLNQINIAIDAGLQIDHITAHHGFMNLGIKMFRTIAEIAKSFNLPIRNNVNDAKPELQSEMYDIVTKLNLDMPRYHFMLSGTKSAPEKIDNLVNSMPDKQILEIVSHAGIISPLLVERSSFTQIREDDLHLILSNELSTIWGRNKSQLVDFSIFQNEFD